MNSTSKRRWILRACIALLLLAGFLGGFFYGFDTNRRRSPPYQTLMTAYYRLKYNPTIRSAAFRFTRDPTRGGWTTMATRDRDREALSQEEIFARLEAIGYVGGTEPASNLEGTTYYDPETAYPGTNLVVSGHGPEARLVDMKGQLLHRWHLTFEAAFPEENFPQGTWGLNYWRRCFLYPNGDLLAIFTGLGIIKVDKDSRLLWAAPNGAHHDMYVAADGHIFVLTRKVRVLPHIHEWMPIMEEFITVLDANGGFVEEFSVLEAIRESDFSSLLGQVEESEGDILHSNSIEIMDGRHVHLNPAFKAGNALLSLRTIDAILSIDLDGNRVVWASIGPFKAQHEASLLDNGRLLLLDNKGHHGRSKVIEMDPLTQRIAWAYAWTKENDFYTPVLGATSRLPNGNTLIVESTRGRAMEVDQNGGVVWEYYNPFRFGADEDKIAVLFDVTRIEDTFPTSWAQASSSDGVEEY